MIMIMIDNTHIVMIILMIIVVLCPYLRASEATSWSWRSPPAIRGSHSSNATCLAQAGTCCITLILNMYIN